MLKNIKKNLKEKLQSVKIELDKEKTVKTNRLIDLIKYSTLRIKLNTIKIQKNRIEKSLIYLFGMLLAIGGLSFEFLLFGMMSKIFLIGMVSVLALLGVYSLFFLRPDIIEYKKMKKTMLTSPYCKPEYFDFAKKTNNLDIMISKSNNLIHESEKRIADLEEYINTICGYLDQIDIVERIIESYNTQKDIKNLIDSLVFECESYIEEKNSSLSKDIDIIPINKEVYKNSSETDINKSDNQTKIYQFKKRY